MVDDIELKRLESEIKTLRDEMHGLTRMSLQDFNQWREAHRIKHLDEVLISVGENPIQKGKGVMMDSDIKTCPFCGGVPELYISTMGCQYDNINNRQYTTLTCNNCVLPNGDAFMVVGEIINGGINPVLEFWNNRK